MFKNICTIIAAIIVCLAGIAAAAPNCHDDYIVPGRQSLFEGTLSGLREAYATFDAGAHSSTCANDRELKFLHALTRITMWGVKDDGGQVDSAVEFAREFGITVLGNSYSELEVTGPRHPASSYGSYEMPAQTPTVTELRAQIFDELLPGLADFAGNAAIPEINSVIAELDSITETPSDRFRIFFYPAETGLKSNLEVDYADVLVLKAGLLFLKSQLQTQTAYDTFTDTNDIIIEKLCAGTLKIEEDLIGRYPNLLKVLPTPGHPADGNAILAQAKQDLINGIDYYTAAVNYMLSEDDPQEDDLLSISPGLYSTKDRIDGELATIRNNLTAGVPITHTTSTTEIYNVRDSDLNLRGNLVLEYDALGQITDGSFDFILSPGDYDVTSWDIKNAQIDDSGFMAEMELSWGWGSGLLAGVISADHKKISNITFEYWGDYEGNANGLTANQSGTTTENVQVSLYPLYKASPVNPRNILPDFDKWNMPGPGTFGKGLGYDATLGGILPQFTQTDWQRYLDLQPSGLFNLQEILFLYPGQKLIYDGETFVGLWLSNQRVFVDPQGDTENNSSMVDNVDIKSLYMGYDNDNLYGSIFSYNFMQNSNDEAAYDLYLSYTPDNPDSLYSIRLTISLGYYNEGYIYYLYNDGYETYWEDIGSFPVHVGRGGVDFSIPWELIPDYLPGRFVSLNSRGQDYNYSEEQDGERNNTHMQIQIGQTGQISGTITCDMATYKGAPITIQAYTDPRDPEGTIVASTIIEQPGPYQLDGVAWGWYGLVRATMPCYQFDTRDIDYGQAVENEVTVFVEEPDTTNINLVLGPCGTSYGNGCGQASRILAEVPRNGITTSNGEVWYYFVADANAVFGVDIANIYADITVFDQCGGKELVSGNSYDGLWLNAQEGQIYHIRIKTYDYDSDYTITVSNYGPAIPNDRCDTAIEVVTDVNYDGTTVGALRDIETECGDDDDFGVWFKFTPPTDGIYEIYLSNNSYDATIVIYDGCGGEKVSCHNAYSYSSVFLNAVADRTYYIRFACNWDLVDSFMLRVSYYDVPLPNDLCANASEITEDIAIDGSTTGAMNNDVWYRFVPANNGIYEVNVQGDYADVHVLDGCEGNDVPMGVSWPRYFKVQAGQTYLVGIEGFGGEGYFTLQLTHYEDTVPANDDKKDAIAIQPGSVEGTTILATKDGESICDGTGVDVWYAFIPSKSGIYKINFESTDFDVSLAIFESKWPGWTGDPAQIVCQSSWDEHSGYFYARAGSLYYVRVAGYWDYTGTFTLRLDEVAVQSSASDLTGDNIVNQLDLEWFFNYWLSSCPQPYWCGGADSNLNLTVDFEDFAELANNWLQTELP